MLTRGNTTTDSPATTAFALWSNMILLYIVKHVHSNCCRNTGRCQVGFVVARPLKKTWTCHCVCDCIFILTF